MINRVDKRLVFKPLNNGLSAGQARSCSQLAARTPAADSMNNSLGISCTPLC